jgi:uncharacterized membrane protein
VKRGTWGRATKRHLIAGLIVIAPLTATIWVLVWIFQLLDGLLGRFLYPGLGAVLGRESFVVPGLGLLVLFLLLVGTGWLAERAIGSRILKWWNGLLERLPVVRRIYGASNRIVRTVFGNEARPFSKVVLVEYPAPGRWAIGFLAGEGPAEAAVHLGATLAVFIPTTPNPTTGWVTFVTAEQVIPLAMSVDEAFTLVLSAGSARPPEIAGSETQVVTAPTLPAE